MTKEKLREILHDKEEILRFSASIIVLEQPYLAQLAAIGMLVDRNGQRRHPLAGPDPITLAARLLAKSAS